MGLHEIKVSVLPSPFCQFSAYRPAIKPPKLAVPSSASEIRYEIAQAGSIPAFCFLLTSLWIMHMQRQCNVMYSYPLDIRVLPSSRGWYLLPMLVSMHVAQQMNSITHVLTSYLVLSLLRLATFSPDLSVAGMCCLPHCGETVVLQLPWTDHACSCSGSRRALSS